MASSDGLQYRALYEYQKDREEDLALCPGDVLTVSRAGLLSSPNYKDGDERNPQGWLHGVNERTKERGDFPGTYVEYLGPARIAASAAKARPRPLPLPPAGTPTAWGLPGQAELTEHPALPEQALQTVARLIEALEKQGTEKHSPQPQSTARGTHSPPPCSAQSAPRASPEPNLSPRSPGAQPLPVLPL
ncbi:phosphatidylinositol 3-kinase regulatory subunit beta-like [Prinia subflava]|uniref:phosphatidylinositol 3-kinase regulatory subunit beta-like n=1 Tax=Prinia subflava TaxID=208062 RepID=UPI002FDF4BFB